MNELGVGNEAEGQEPLSLKWRGAQSIRLVQQLNEQYIDLFCELAVEPIADSSSSWPLVELNRDLWSRLDTVARRRLAMFPFVIVDVRFRNEVWWQVVCKEHSSAPNCSATSNVLPSARNECLALETLMFAWQVAREDRRVAQMILGMAPSVAECIAVLTMQQVRTIGIEISRFLRMRWEDDPQFWRELLISAREADEISLATLRLDAKLLFCGDLLNARLP